MASDRLRSFLMMFGEYPQVVVPDVDVPGIPGPSVCRPLRRPTDNTTDIVQCTDGYSEWWLVHLVEVETGQAQVLVVFEHQGEISVVHCRHEHNPFGMTLPVTLVHFHVSPNVAIAGESGYQWHGWSERVVQEGARSTWRLYMIINPLPGEPRWLIGRFCSVDQISFIAH